MTTSYSYDGTQVDRLPLFGLKSITYDSLGCVKTYDGWTYGWNKGRLAYIQKGSLSTSRENYGFTYNAYGQRTKVTYSFFPGVAQQIDYIASSTTEYTYDNSGRLIRESYSGRYNDNTTVTREYIFLYDESGIVGCLFAKNGATPAAYFYRKNLQGDVTAIYNESGNKVGEYAYDAWGNCTVLSGAATDVVRYNPIRYRGYYYDIETGLYYLNARYYNPEWRRFISPDSTEYIDAENPNGVNLYVYCNNDPINYIDPTGHITVLAFVISISISLAFEVLDDYLDGGLGDGSHDWKDYLGAGVSGFFGALGGDIVAQAVYSLIGGFADAALSGDLEEYGFWNTMGSIATSSLISFGIGTLANRVASGIKASQLKKLSNRLGNNAANRKLRAMGATIKIGSNAAKAKGGLSKAIRTDSKWIGNVLSDKLPGSISGGIVSLGYGHLSERYGWYF